MESSLISIIVPVYNVEQYLDRCLKSIKNQTYKHFECILVDDGSTDSSSQICEDWKKADDRFVCIHKVNGGLSDARNTGIRLSHGDYITFVDSDDWIYPDYLEILYQGIEQYEADIASSALVRFSSECESNAFSRSKITWNCYSQSEYLKYYFRIKGNKAVHYVCGKLFSKRILSERQFPVGMLNEDVEGFYKALLNARTVAETTRETYCYYYNENSITGQGFGVNYLCLNDVWDRIVCITRERLPEMVWAAEYNKLRADFTILCDSIIHGSKDSDIKYAIELSECQNRLRKNLKTLLAGPMRLYRKAALIIVAFFYRQIVFIKRR